MFALAGLPTLRLKLAQKTENPLRQWKAALIRQNVSKLKNWTLDKQGGKVSGWTDIVKHTHNSYCYMSFTYWMRVDTVPMSV